MARIGADPPGGPCGDMRVVYTCWIASMAVTGSGTRSGARRPRHRRQAGAIGVEGKIMR